MYSDIHVYDKSKNGFHDSESFKTNNFLGLIGVFRPTGEGLQILTYTRHSWPLSSEGSLGATPTETGGIRV